MDYTRDAYDDETCGSTGQSFSAISFADGSLRFRRHETPTKKLVIVGSSQSAADKELARLFKKLTARWQQETALVSSPSKIAMHDAYQRTIGLGPAVLPLVFEELERRPHWWFWALRALTGADPVTDEQRGDLTAMRDAWLLWREENGKQEASVRRRYH